MCAQEAPSPVQSTTNTFTAKTDCSFKFYSKSPTFSSPFLSLPQKWVKVLNIFALSLDFLSLSSPYSCFLTSLLSPPTYLDPNSQGMPIAFLLPISCPPAATAIYNLPALFLSSQTLIKLPLSFLLRWCFLKFLPPRG